MLFTVVKPNSYQDSVSLMLLTNKLSDMEGVKKISIMMGTAANKDIFKSSGLLTAEVEAANANDICIVVDSETRDIVDKVLSEVDNFLTNQASKTQESGYATVHSWSSALSNADDANMALISIPGQYAYDEAKFALEKGLHVFMFSDNVTIEEEIKLKELAKEKGLLMMGPDCGTGIISTIPIAFANVVRPGPIGIIGASGTGIQEVTSIIDKLGSGISHAIGTGGRDLSEKVGAITVLESLKGLVNDDATKVIVVISKPPAATVREKVVSELKKVPKPVVALFVGEKPAIEFDGKIHYTWTLEDTAKRAVELAGSLADNANDTKNISDELETTISQMRGSSQKYIMGLFSGGTLAAEAAMLIKESIPGKDESSHTKGVMLKIDGHQIIDLGDDVYTQGRPHPMIDPRLRAEMIQKEAENTETAVILLDIVLGYGSNDDMAGALVPSIKKAKEISEKAGRRLLFVASVCGTDKDPQNYDVQVTKLKEAGVVVENNNAAAVRKAIYIASKLGIEEPSCALRDFLSKKPTVINLGLRSFADTLQKYGSKVVQYEWKPAAGGNKKLVDLLSKLK